MRGRDTQISPYTPGGTCGLPRDDLTGRVFSKWTVVRFVGRSKWRVAYWECLCSCGNRRYVSQTPLLRGDSVCCGCTMAEHQRLKHTTHGKSHTPEYGAWKAMLHRCQSPKDARYKDYGGRGISVCDRWQNVDSFISDMGSRPSPKHTLDRIDNDGDYCPENCRWVVRSVQDNNKRNNRYLVHSGLTLTISEWSRRTGICVSLIRQRLRKGRTTAEALETPVKRKTITLKVK